MAIERRDEPYLDEALEAELEREVLGRYPTRQAATLPVLRAVQQKYGYLPYQVLEEVAAFLEQTPSQVHDTATFYDEFRFAPVGRYLIGVCRSLSCELMGQQNLLERLKKKLGIDVGQTTEDGKFTLITMECLGACDGAPAALVNDKLHERLTPENFEAVLDSLE
jgi:NADH-quinone oxidoreductase E subunit